MDFFEGCEGFETVEDLLRASAEMLRKGSVGSTYKAVMEGGGKAAVVKRVRERGRWKVGDWKEVDGLTREIGQLRKANVVGLRAYYWSKHEMLLVYDYMPNGSLHSLLHGVESVTVDKSNNKLTVVGKLNPEKIRSSVENKIKKKVELVSPLSKNDKSGKNKEGSGRVGEKDQANGELIYVDPNKYAGVYACRHIIDIVHHPPIFTHENSDVCSVM